MDLPDYEKIFLLEILVDEVYISNSILNLDLVTKSNLKETCVMFQFLNYPPLVVCEEDFSKSPPNTYTSQTNFNIGKSCLFSINSSVAQTLPHKFTISVTVLRKVEPNSKIVVGTTVINLGDSFTALIHSNNAEFPIQKTISGRFDVYDDKKTVIGYTDIFIRLSSFGSLIVSQFQVGEETSIFKGTEQKKIAELPGDYTKLPKIQVSPNYVPSKDEKDVVQSKGDGDLSELMLFPIKSVSSYQSYCEQPQQSKETLGDYKEIIAEMRGHSLHIRIPRKQKTEDKLALQEVCRYASDLDLCDSDFPVLPEAILQCEPF